MVEMEEELECVNCHRYVEPVYNNFSDPKNPRVGLCVETCPLCGGTL